TKTSIAAFSFTISDVTSDGFATKVSTLKIKAGENNTVDFTKVLYNGNLVNSKNEKIPFTIKTIEANTITVKFAEDALNIADTKEETFTVNLSLNNKNIPDGGIIQLMIDADDNEASAYTSGSLLKPELAKDIVGNNIKLNVTATQLQFKADPKFAYVNESIKNVFVEATDANGNIDTDYTSEIIIKAKGASFSNSTTKVAAKKGVAEFNKLIFNAKAENVVLIASSVAFKEVITETFNVTNRPNGELFFSEYIEGLGENKALEIYNPTDVDIDLSNYIIRVNSNGKKWSEAFEFPKGKTIAAQDVFVVVNKTSEDLIKLADFAVVNPYLNGGKSYVAVFNGDDVRALCKIEGTDTIIVDVIGRYDLKDPGTGWNVAGVEHATKDHVLLRKSDITKGNTNWDASAGTNAENSEWIVKKATSFDNLGKFGETSNDILDFSLDKQTAYGIMNFENHTIDIEVSVHADVTKLVASFMLSEGATAKVGEVAQVSGTTTNDFTNPVKYIVSSKNGKEQVWTITVTIAKEESLQNAITGITVKNMVGLATIEDGTVHVKVKYGTDITNLNPVFEISCLASIADTTLARDFTKPQTYVVTAENGNTKNWVVTIEKPTVVEVANIAALKAKYKKGDKTIYKVTGEVTFTYATKPSYYIQDKTGAISIYAKTGITTNYKIGDNVKNITLSLSDYFGAVQSYAKSDPGAAISSNNEVETPELTIDEYNKDYQKYIDKLVTIKDVRFKEKGKFEIKKNYTLTNGTSKLIVRTKFTKANYIGNNISTELLKVTGIGGVFKKVGQIYPRQKSDIQILSGIEDNTVLNSIKLYPNPSNGLITLELNNTKNTVFTIEIFNVTGNLVYKTKTTSSLKQIDLTNMAHGVYYVNINNGISRKVSKIMIQ
ncbi:MAG: lamin tail domain-containing protein, partial [Bacteroidales bacterium]|nr:lamin tail domain-containing protein [Bacteroidales bacterium]